MSKTGKCCRQRGFTIVELLVVVAIIAILLSLLVPTTGRVLAMSRRVTCASNMRQLASAWVNYMADNKGWIVGGDTNANCWVQAGNTEASIRNGLLFKYINNVDLYRCPSDPFRSNLRTYSVNCGLNGELSPKWTRRSDIKNPNRTFLMIEEWDPRGYNVNSFGIPPTGDSWIDFPATWHDWGANLSFTDGHVEFWRWDETRTRDLTSFYANTPNNPDLKSLQAVVRPN